MCRTSQAKTIIAMELGFQRRAGRVVEVEPSLHAVAESAGNGATATRSPLDFSCYARGERANARRTKRRWKRGTTNLLSKDSLLEAMSSPILAQRAAHAV